MKTQNAYGCFQVQINDSKSFLGPPWTCFDAYFVLKVFESLQPSQLARQCLSLEGDDNDVKEVVIVFEQLL